VVSEGRATRIVGTVRDITERKGIEIALLATEERYRLVTRATNDAIWDWDLVADSVLWNDALCTAYDWEPAQVEPTGAWWLARIHPDDRAMVEADIRAVIDGSAEDWSHEYRFRRADGRYAEVLDRGFMVRGPDGAPLRMIGAMLDITERSQAEAQFRAVFEGANVGIVQFDPVTVTALRVNAKLRAIWGAEETDIVGHSLARWTPPEDAAARDALHRRIATGETIQERFEKRYRRKDGRIIWARVNLVSQRLGETTHATTMIEDITEEKLEDARRDALIELSDRLRDLHTSGEVVAATAEVLGRTLAVARAGYAIVDLAKGVFTMAQDWTDHRIASLADVHPLSIFRATVERLRSGETLVVPDIAAMPALAADAISYAQIRTRAQIEVPLLQRGRLVGVLYAQEREPRAWTQGEIVFAREVAERAFGGLTRIAADEQQRILNRELSHRLKNTLAMVQAIASQTLRNVTDVDAAKEALAARLIALGKAHDILLTGESESAGMAEVIEGALSLHDDQQPGRFRIEGPPITIGSKAALSLSLMIHELATNAAKYGALSAPEGSVAIVWAVDAGREEPNVHLTWTERGGPRVAAPARKGFGSRLIERGLAGAVGGEVDLTYEPDGVVCRVDAPLAGFAMNG
jgi:PAS domain S-box-containing protein